MIQRRSVNISLPVSLGRRGGSGEACAKMTTVFGRGGARIWLGGALAAIGLSGCSSTPETDLSSVPVSYAQDIQPVLAANCYKCHGPDLMAPSGKLRLDTRENMMKGGRRGRPVIIPGFGEGSPLVIGIRGGDRETWRPMPPRGRKLNRREVELIHRWIDQGASFDESKDR